LLLLAIGVEIAWLRHWNKERIFSLGCYQ